MKASIDTTAIRNRRLWIALVASIVLNASTLATHALGQPAPDNTPLRFHDHAAATAIDAFDRTGLWILASGAIATSVAFQFDQSMHDQWKGHQRISEGVSSVGDFWGTGVPEVLILLGQTYYDREKGIAGLEGLALGALVTHSTKYLTARSRPDSDTKTSFPSGHTQAAFSLATSLWMSYGWSAGLPLAGLGVFTGLTRIADNAHWLSDVVAGATIGILFGRSGFRHHESAAPLVAPMIEIDDADGRVSLLGLQVQQDF